MISPAALAPLLPDHLRAQRWFGHRDAGGPIDVTHIETLRDGWPGLVRVEVEVGADSGPPARYQLLLALRPAAHRPPGDPATAVVGELPTAHGTAVAYDALTDPEVAVLLLPIIAPGITAASARPLSAEQSNSSVVYDERLILKVFRRLYGSNPDVEVTRALAGLGFPHVPAPIAAWQSSDDLALLQTYLPGSSDGWSLALTSIRDLVGAERFEGYEDEPLDPAAAGGDFAPESSRLGRLTAAMHVALAEAFGAKPGQPREWAEVIETRLSSVSDPALDLRVPRALAARLADLTDAGAEIRIHGDYHLGQVLSSDEGWFVFDFEGEPARPLDSRLTPASPLRDVAGMLRSLDYAVQAVLTERGEATSGPAREWERRNRDAFLDAYLAEMDGTGLLPESTDSRRVILGALELDKAVYEVGYEQAHRPTWVEIPLAGVRRLSAEWG